MEGKVKVCRSADDKREIVIEIYRTEEFFGESALLRLPRRGEHAIALEPTKLMSWTNTKVEELLEKRPRLAVALLQIVIQRELDLTNRIASFVVDKTSRRLARSLIWLSDRLGRPQADGVRMGPLTQKLLSQYISTSREAVSFLMNEFRRYGYLDYSGREITLSREALMEWLRDPQGVFGPSDTAGAHEEVRQFCTGSAGI